jgi:glyoxylase-like metal-dependent hydrolase (beta-lactamase superfamily II)
LQRKWQESRRIVFEDSVLPIINAKQAVTIIPQGGEYLDGLAFHPTPGHSIGHMSISLTSQGEKALFTGDVLHSPLQVYQPQWNSIFCVEKELACQSRLWLLKFAVDQGAKLFTAHFPETSAGVVNRHENRFEWQFI